MTQIEQSKLVAPHGGVLVDRTVGPDGLEALRQRAGQVSRLVVDAREGADLELIATGAASPLTGFLGREDYEAVLQSLRLASGVVWPLPLTLAVEEEQVARLVRELVAGKGFAFASRGEEVLRGFDDPVRIFELNWRQ